MKNFKRTGLSFVGLLMLLACGGELRERSPRAKSQHELYAENYALKVGDVTVRSEVGTDYQFVLDPETKKKVLTLTKIEKSVKKIVLKIESGAYYEYMESDQSDIKPTVNKQSFNPLAQVKRLRKEGYNFVNGFAVIERSVSNRSIDNGEEEEELYEKLTYSHVYDKKISLLSPCEARYTDKKTNLVHVTASDETALEPTTITVEETCGAPLSREEHQKIDLKKIRYCDMTTSAREVKCEQGKNLSDLLKEEVRP